MCLLLGVMPRSCLTLAAFSPTRIILTSQRWHLRRVHVLNPTADYIPPEMVSLFITNAGTALLINYSINYVWLTAVLKELCISCHISCQTGACVCALARALL